MLTRPHFTGSVDDYQPVRRVAISCLWFCWLILLSLLPLKAYSHPHSFIDLKTDLLVEHNQLNGLKMTWTMDEITSADLLYDAGSAKAGSPVWKKLAAEVMANVIAQGYFTEMSRNGQRITFKSVPQEYHLYRAGNKAVLTFILLLRKPEPLAGSRWQFSVFDPSYYIDMAHGSERDVTLSSPPDKPCKTVLHQPNPGDTVRAYAQSLDQNDSPEEQQDLGRQFAQKVELICK